MEISPKNSNEPLISIIIPIHNTALYLIRCLESIINQTLKPIEIICVNDGSTDSSLEILASYQKIDSRIKIITQEYKGVSEARNIGINNAIGTYIGFVDSDDYISPEMFEKLYNAIKKNNTDIVVCNYFKKEKEEIKPNSKKNSYLIDNESQYLEELLLDENIQNYLWTRLYKKELFKDIKFPKDKVFEDIFISTDLIGRIDSAYYLEEPLYCYCIREDSITNKIDKKVIDDAIESYYNRYLKIKDHYKELEETNVFSMLKWLSGFKKCFDIKDEFHEKYKTILKEIISDYEKTKIEKYKNDQSYEDIIELITSYQKWLNTQ